MKKQIKYIASIILVVLSSFSTATAQIRAREVKPETCSVRNDGEAEVVFGNNAPASMFDVLWTLKDGSTRTSARITGLASGQYHVKVTPKSCPSVIVFEGYVGVSRTQDCPGPHVSISGSTYAESCETPCVELTSSAWGGTPPLRVSWHERKVCGSGHICVGCSVIDSNGLSETSYINIYLKKLECSQDPNEIAGPTGYDDSLHFVNSAEKMNYNISFENDPDFATAPATRVSITYPVPPQQNIASFRLSDFGFGSHIFTVPSNSTSYSNRLDVSDDLGVWVDVTAGIDIINNNLYWIFQSIDPATGFEPASSQMGFLPVNDSLGSGEGYVSFLIAPKSNVQTGDTCSVDATIVFDDNAPIPTNKWLNTFDVVPPTSTLTAQISESDSTVATFTFSATDDNGGSGVDYIELYVAIDNGIYQYVSTSSEDSVLTYTLEEGHTYRFATSAVDFVGNHELLKEIPDTIIDNNNAPTDILLTNSVFNENDPIGTTVGRLMSLDNDITQPFVYALVDGEGDDDNALFRIENGELKTNAIFSCNGRYEYYVRVKTTDVSGLSFEKALEIGEIQQNYTETLLLQRDICQGNSVLFGTQNYTVAGTYIDSLKTFRGCDSIVTMQLRVHPVYNVNDIKVACDSLSWHGRTFTASDDTTVDMMYSTMGCDSIVNLNLTVNYSNTGVETVTACDAYSWWNTNYTSSTNTPIHVYTNTQGCDSTVTLNLTVNYSTAGSETVTACDSYTWHGTSYTTAGTQLATMTNAAGCDSVVTLHLTINYSNTGVETVTACDSYTWWNTNYTSSTNTPIHVYTNTQGCDSTVTLNLTVNYSNTGVETVTACDAYSWWNTNYTSSTNTPIHVYTNTQGCDSTVTLNLTVNYSSTGSETVTACDSYTWHGTSYTTAGTQLATMTNAVGCDSVVTLHLTINYSTAGTDVQTACDSYTWHGTTYTASTNTPIHVYTNTQGCDSTVTLNLTVNYSNTGVETVTACDSYTWWNTNYTNSTNTPVHVYTNTQGCDSTVTLNLTINYSTTGSETVTACDSYTWHGTSYTTAGTQLATMTNAAGCDSVVTLYLTINYSTAGDTTAVACDEFTWHGTTYTTSTNTPLHVYTNTQGCDSTVTLHLTVNYSTTSTDVQTACESFTWIDGVTYTTGGDGIATYTTTNAAGCDSVITLNLTVNYNTTGVDVQSACDEFTWIDGVTYTAGGDGIATYRTTNAAGCDSVITLNLTINHGVTVYDSLNLTSNEIPYDYHGNTIPDAGDYTFNGTTTEGCDSTTLLHVEVTPVGLDAADPLAGLKVYPNPTRGTLTIDADDVISVEVFDLAGRLVETFEGVNSFDITNLAAGTYTLRIETTRGETVRRIVKK